MKNREQLISEFRAKWLPGFALVIILYLIYSPVFLTDYLMGDEWIRIGLRTNLIRGAISSFFRSGRGLFAVYSSLVYGFVQYDPFRIQFVRFLNFASLVTIATILFLFLEKRSKNSWYSFLVILFLFSQRSFQGVMAYSLQLISNSQPAMWLSLLAFYVHFYFARSRFPKLLSTASVFIILILAMQSTQTYAFFSIVPVTYLTLTDWKNEKRKIVEFLFITLGVFLFSSLIYKIGLNYWHDLGEQGYGMGEQGLEAVIGQPVNVLLQAINPFAYWGAFEIWSYPFPFHYTFPFDGMKRIIACFIMISWGLLILLTINTELQKYPEDRRQVVLKWLTALICLGFGAIFFIADSPLNIAEHRPHITLTFVGVATFFAAYCVQVLASKHLFLRSMAAKSIGIICVIMIAFGAQANILRGFVTNRMEELDFVRTELVANSTAGFRNIIVVLPEWMGCITEPCGPWAGHVTEGRWHITRKGAYRYALATTGISPEDKNIIFVEQMPEKIPEDSIIIDWNKHASAKKAHQDYLQQGTHF